MNNTPRSNRIHISIFGRRNAGKSSLINFITDQPVSLVSNYAGTTTDPVYKNMEINPLGPVTFIDTAGFDDEGEIGQLRVNRTKDILDKTDTALIVISATGDINIDLELKWVELLKNNMIPTVIILSKRDSLPDLKVKERAKQLSQQLKSKVLPITVKDKKDRFKVISEIIQYTPIETNDTLTGDLYNEGDIIVLVTPQDIQAPKGRLILPQVQVIRDILDHNAIPCATQTNNLGHLLDSLKTPPALVITDSQIFGQVSKIVPDEIPLTSFSVIMARHKGDLATFIHGANTIDRLTPKSHILIAESCTHAPLEEDIGREKIPAMLRKKYGDTIKFDIATGLTFPDNLKKYDLILHCGGCMFTKKQLMARLVRANEENIPITNYGITIAKLTGILDRVTKVFPELRK